MDLFNFFKKQDPRQTFLEEKTKAETAIQGFVGSQELISALNLWFEKYELISKEADILLEKIKKQIQITEQENIIINGKINEVNTNYKTIIDREKLLRGDLQRLRLFGTFRKDFLNTMNNSLITKGEQIRQKAPKVLKPTYIPPVLPQSQLPSLQARLNALNKKGGKRKTQHKKLKRRQHKKTRR
jgi:hypothetical protein